MPDFAQGLTEAGLSRMNTDTDSESEPAPTHTDSESQPAPTQIDSHYINNSTLAVGALALAGLVVWLH